MIWIILLIVAIFIFGFYLIFKNMPKISREEFFKYYKVENGKYQATTTFWIKIAEENTSVDEAYEIYLRNYKEIDKNFMYMNSLLKSKDGGWK